MEHWSTGATDRMVAPIQPGEKWHQMGHQWGTFPRVAANDRKMEAQSRIHVRPPLLPLEIFMAVARNAETHLEANSDAP